MEKKSISVRAMGAMLGLGKVESYWLVHKGYFTTVTAGGRMRVLLDSFEEWYANQLHYAKVNGDAPGSKIREVYWTIGDVAMMLGISESTVYDLLKSKPLTAVRFGQKTCIEKASFEKWYKTQTHYNKVEEVG